MMYTTGSRLAGRLDAQRPEPWRPVTVDGAEFMGECHAHGIRRRITADMVDAWGEAEYAARTEGIFAGLPDCPDCHQRISVSGVCGCGAATRTARLAAAIFGEPLEAAADAPGLTTTEAREPLRRRPLETPEAQMPCSAHLPDPPDDATPAEVDSWRERYRAMRQTREDILRGCHREYRSLYGMDPYS